MLISFSPICFIKHFLPYIYLLLVYLSRHFVCSTINSAIFAIFYSSCVYLVCKAIYSFFWCLPKFSVKHLLPSSEHFISTPNIYQTPTQLPIPISVPWYVVSELTGSRNKYLYALWLNAVLSLYKDAYAETKPSTLLLRYE